MLLFVMKIKDFEDTTNKNVYYNVYYRDPMDYKRVLEIPQAPGVSSWEQKVIKFAWSSLPLPAGATSLFSSPVFPLYLLWPFLSSGWRRVASPLSAVARLLALPRFQAVSATRIRHRALVSNYRKSTLEQSSYLHTNKSGARIYVTIRFC